MNHGDQIDRLDAAIVLQAAEGRAAERDRIVAQRPRVDYDALNRMVRRQRSALTRAINSSDPKANVILACKRAVNEWNQEAGMWPDDWGRWQRALDDVLGWRSTVQLSDL